MFGIAIGCGGHEHLLLACVESIRKGSPDVPICITFDGFVSSNETRDWLINLGCFYDTHDTQRGISKTWNSSIKMCLDRGADYVCVLNDDTVVPIDFVQSYVGFFERHPNVQIACSLDRLTARTVLPVLREWYTKVWAEHRLPPETDLVERIYAPRTFAQLCEDIKRFDVPEFTRCRMNGACFVLSKSCVDSVGLFDEDFIPPGLFEDLDVWGRCLLKPGPDSMGTFTRSFIHHIRSSTLSNYPKAWAEARVAENSALFRSKWPREKYGALEDWLSTVNALPVGTEEPPFPPEFL